MSPGLVWPAEVWCGGWEGLEGRHGAVLHGGGTEGGAGGGGVIKVNIVVTEPSVVVINRPVKNFMCLKNSHLPNF